MLVIDNNFCFAAGHAVDTEGKKHPRPVIFKDANDTDYQAILAMVEAVRKNSIR
jgi:hypothetical protein